MPIISIGSMNNRFLEKYNYKKSFKINRNYHIIRVSKNNRAVNIECIST